MKDDDDLLQPGDLALGFLHLARKWRSVLAAAKIIGTVKGDAKSSLGLAVETAAREFPHAAAVKSEAGELSYAELNARANRLAHHLTDSGVKRGDAVALLLDNRAETLIAVAAITKLGAIASMINPHQRHRSLLHSFHCCEPALIIVGEELLDAFLEVRSELSVPSEQIRLERDPLLAELRELPEGWQWVEEACRHSSTENPSTTPSITASETAFYIFTSGTTGLPKAARMSHKRWVGAGWVFGRACLDLGESDTLYAPLPLHHNQALTMSWASAVVTGAALAIRRKLSASEFWDDCRLYRATAFSYIGEMPRYLLNRPPSTRDSDHEVRKCVGVGLRPDMWMQFEQRFGLEEIYEFYGASELNLAFVNYLNLDRTVGWCPVPWKLVEYDVDADAPARGPDGHLVEVERGGTGLLLGQVSERFPFEGYTDDDATERKLIRDAFEPGDCWVNSGDLMRNIGYGHLQFVDRVGDTFRWKSENVSTTEVEQVINASPEVEESTVYGVEVPGHPGRAGMAAIVAKNARAFDAGALLEQMRVDLPAYAVPVFVRLVDSLTTTGTHKHRKVELRKESWHPQGQQVLVLLPGESAYRPLDEVTAARIRAGEQRL